MFELYLDNDLCRPIQIELLFEDWGLPLNLWSLAVLLAVVITPLLLAAVARGFEKFMELLLEWVQTGPWTWVGRCQSCSQVGVKSCRFGEVGTGALFLFRLGSRAFTELSFILTL